ncbi:mercuric reductase [Aspergillus homomorphus CBS 101889]|uniref:FAD-dependent pyridine nucleotide-disulfide oxidoreductase n=1 Tax=Aspergillus homomorphus (strain CBS 101889) TaxID=1450537 RepID=A0A395HN48_ASPHC|nr:FAD-dependent pyridine nucleotide-disulfide oxidoreductase [Aspergillus homomorphus CBS 101889]RAL09351.1 FAD-dependent pyridine nucleotide-disulfide oxidoreductase [Aspergillus homomorphus CBS 101889]
MTTPKPTHYDAIIIGSGQGGTPLATALAEAKHKTALIERAHLGGCCVNEGCTPTKTMIASGRVAHLVRRGAEYGVHSSGSGDNAVTTDMLRVRQRKREIVASFRAGSERRLREAGVEVLMGEARFVDGEGEGEKRMVVAMREGGVRVVSADTVVVNTGCRPAVPVVEGIERIPGERVLDSSSVMELGEVPRHLVVVGGGYIGVEFGQLFRRLGARVTLLHRGMQLLPREDQDLADMLLDVFRDEGVEVLLETTPVRILSSPNSDGAFDVLMRTKQGDRVLQGATHILFAAGRVPNTECLNLGAAGVSTDAKGYIVTNEYLETSVPSIYAIGDVKGLPAFTHISYDDSRILRSSLLPSRPAAQRRSTRDRLVPYVAFTDPQFAHVGLHEHEARERYPDKQILTAQMPMSYVARALEIDETRGAMKAVVDAESGLILGFSCLGVEGGELMGVVQMAMVGELPYHRLRDAVFAHPTLAECLNNLWGFLK